MGKRAQKGLAKGLSPRFAPATLLSILVLARGWGGAAGRPFPASTAAGMGCRGPFHPFAEHI